MGNCLRRESPTQWGGDNWGSDGTNFMKPSAEEELLVQRGFTRTSSSLDYVTDKASKTEIKIKITRKQLEELLARVDVKELSVQQVLAQLIHDKFGTDTDSKRSSSVWRPNLESIPERSTVIF